jgi:hypothetical protein
VVGWTQKALIGTFLRGLKVEISLDVCKFKPRTLRATIKFARMREDELNHMNKPMYSDISKYSPKPPWESSPTTTPPSPKTTGSQVKKLSWDEMQQRREKGLCFNCNEQYTPGHRCAVSRLFIIEAEADDNDSPEGEAIPDEDDDSRNPTISLHA